MKRLMDRDTAASPLEARAISLLRSVERFQSPAGMKQRVRARIIAAHASTRIPLFRPVLVVSVLLVAAGASAALGYFRTHSPLNPDPLDHASNPLADASMIVARVGSAAPPASTGPTEPGRELVSEPAPIAQPDSVPAATALTKTDPQTDRDRTAVASGSPAHAGSQRSEEGQLVFDSMRALRRDGQPERAARLLDDYLRHHPNGAQAEEALALSIEAATLRGNPRARDLATRYLARYPNGQFKKAAERARARFSP